MLRLHPARSPHSPTTPAQSTIANRILIRSSTWQNAILRHAHFPRGSFISFRISNVLRATLSANRICRRRPRHQDPPRLPASPPPPSPSSKTTASSTHTHSASPTLPRRNPRPPTSPIPSARSPSSSPRTPSFFCSSAASSPSTTPSPNTSPTSRAPTRSPCATS